MTRVQIVLVIVSALVIGASVAVAAGAFEDDESEPAARASSSTTKRPRLTAPHAINRVPKARAAGCRNLRLSAGERSSLEAGVFRDEAVKGSVYFGACEGSMWSMARFEGGGDGVFRNVRSEDSQRLGSIADAKCEVPAELLKLWRQYDGCAPQQTVREPPSDDEPATAPPSEPPTQPRGNDAYPPGDSRRRYPNGRTYIQQVNWCNLMRQQGVPCTVPPPP